MNSVLAERLYEVWSMGRISSPLLGWLAEGGLLDLDRVGPAADPVRPMLAKLSAIGATGEFANNTRRDLLTSCFDKLQMPEPLAIRVPYIRDPSRRRTEFTHASFIMPNELFEHLYLHYNEFFSTCVAVDLPTFWDGVRTDDPVARDHPAMAQRGYRTSAVPVMILADKVQYTEDEQSLHVLAWAPVQNTFSSVWLRIFLLAAFPSACCCKQQIDGASTMAVFWKWTAHGFTALCNGVHPDRDPDGYPWPAGSSQAALAGKPIAGGEFNGAFWGLQSDLEYAVFEWGVPHWNARSPCLHCGASRTDPALNIRDVSLNAGWRGTWRAQADRQPPSESPLWLIPGASPFSYRGEWMHTWEEGIVKNLHASALHDLLEDDGPFSAHGSFLFRLDALRTALARHVPPGQHCHKVIKSKSVGKPSQAFPTLCFCKAWQAKELVGPLLGLLYEVSDGSEHVLHIVRAYESLHAIVLCLDPPGLFLDEASADALNRNANEFVQHYDWLTKSCLIAGKFRYNPVFKLHWLLHLAWSARWLHPRATWTYAFEDFCGRLKHVAIACMRGTPKAFLAKKVAQQWTIAFHCRALPLRA